MSKDVVNALPFGHPERLVDISGDLSLDFSVVNWANYIRNVNLSPRPLPTYLSRHFIRTRS